MGGMGGGMGGAGAGGADLGGLGAMMSDPEIMEALQDPDVQKAFAVRCSINSIQFIIDHIHFRKSVLIHRK